jgi:16S rRNA (adenine1518-N6/adenine1519-N6)-dimethyltransferase
LAERAAAVVTVEVDRNLQQLAREELERHDNIRFVCADALANKNRLNPAVLEAVATELSADSKRQFKLAANLPYNIATPIVSNLLVAPAVPTSMTVTIQKEVAERLAARPSTKDYSALSVWVQSLCEVELIRILPPSVFWPRPRVESAIVQIRPQPALRARVADVEYFHAFIRALFLHRRKFLRGVLIAVTQDRLGKAAVDRILESFGFPSDRRAEQLAVDELLALTEAVRSTEASRSI